MLIFIVTIGSNYVQAEQSVGYGVEVKMIAKPTKITPKISIKYTASNRFHCGVNPLSAHHVEAVMPCNVY